MPREGPGAPLQSALDLRNDLEDILRELQSGGVTARGQAVSSRPRRLVPWRIAIAAGLIFMAGGGLGTWYQAWRGAVQPSLSIVRALDGEGPAVQVARTEGAATPFFSPDGAWIAFWSGGQLRKVPRGGGPVTDIGPMDQFVSGNWGEGDQILLGTNDTVYKVPAAGGTPEALEYLRRSEAERIRFPQFINGSTILYALVRGSDLTDSEIVAEPLIGGRRTFLTADGLDARVVGGRYLVFIRAGTMMVAPLRRDKAEARRPASGGARRNHASTFFDTHGDRDGRRSMCLFKLRRPCLSIRRRASRTAQDADVVRPSR
jgi:hypothetical protein